jgi:adenosylcobinamide-phosphate synthase
MLSLMWSAAFEYHVVLMALLIDFLVGDPAWFYRRVAHPVVMLGNVIDFAERSFNTASNRVVGFIAGLLTVVLVVGLAVASAVLLRRWAFEPFAYGWLLEAVVASSLLAFRSLYEHAKAVACGLAESLGAGRDAVRHMVGRDPQSLDEAGVARAAIESVAENFSDAVLVPVFWYVLAGLPGLFAYKAINTLDSMLGHRTDRYRYFGKAAARLDDLVNYVPARLAGMLFVAAAFVMPRATGAGAFRTVLRDAGKHRSPNAGWPESAVAGALDMALAGPRRYPHETVDDAWMGDGRADIGATDIHASLSLYLIAGALVALGLLALWSFA